MEITPPGYLLPPPCEVWHTWHGAADIACGVADIRHGVADMAHGAADEYHFF